MKKTSLQKVGKDRAAFLRSMISRATEGEPEALAQLRVAFDTAPELWSEVGDIALQARRSMVQAAAGKNSIVAEAFTRKIGAMQNDLAGPAPSPLESLLAEFVSLCWFEALHLDALGAQSSDVPIPIADFYQRRLDHCHKRLLAAVKTLALVRRLLRPPLVQVNVAEQQQVINARSGD